MKIEREINCGSWMKFEWKHEEHGMAIGQHKSQRWHKRNFGLINLNYCVLGGDQEMFPLVQIQWNSGHGQKLKSWVLKP